MQKTSEPPIGENSTLKLVIHTQFGLITFETDDKDEINAAITAIADCRRERQKGLDSRKEQAA
ncbi:MAG: hypothetical protein WC455_11695 [Dehalococcoidia bacterium]|jgi:hypothetical protein